MGRTKGLTTEECRNRRVVMADQVRNGKTVGEVARIHGVAPNSVYMACGVHKSLLPRSVQCIQRAFRIVRLLDPPNRTQDETALLCDVSAGWVRRIELLAVEAGILCPEEDRR